jgi:hypothetical protein
MRGDRMLIFAVVFLTWFVLSVPLGVVIGRFMAASERQTGVAVQESDARRVA